MQSLDLLDAPDDAALARGAPLMLPVDSIDEDPAQPRREFSAEKLGELAQTIAARGVRAPISVRPHPTQTGRWLLNVGARRLRASKLAGRLEIPAFVDRTFDAYDQVIENEQREALKPIELARFVEGELRAGRTRTEIARRLGKSGAYITYVCALIDPPDWLVAAYRDGKCKGAKQGYQLRRWHEEHPGEVQRWLEEQGSSTTTVMSQPHREPATSSSATPPTPDDAALPGETPPASTLANPSVATARPRATKRLADVCDPPVAARLRILAIRDHLPVEVVLDRVPPEIGNVFVLGAGSKARVAVPISSLRSIQLCRGGVRVDAPDPAIFDSSRETASNAAG